MMLPYPSVLGELDTMRLVAEGASLARYGDGELALCEGRSIKTQVYDPALSARLRGILTGSGRCLVGIPNIQSQTPKMAYWGKYRACAHLLVDRPYVSSFVTRPDSAPWLDVPAYWLRLESLWIDETVTLVRGSDTSLCADDLLGARTVHEVVAPRQHAWAEYPQLLKRVLASQPARVLLCLGPTATVMAVDLCAQGIHAVDLGHVGLFLKKHRRGEPLVVTEADKVPA